MVSLNTTITGEETQHQAPEEATPSFKFKTRDLAGILQKAKEELESSGKSDDTNGLETRQVSDVKKDWVQPSLNKRRIQFAVLTITCALLFAGVVTLAVYLVNHGNAINDAWKAANPNSIGEMGPGRDYVAGGLVCGILGGAITGFSTIALGSGVYESLRRTNIDSEKGRDKFAKAILQHHNVQDIGKELKLQKEKLYIEKPNQYGSIGTITTLEFLELLIVKETNDRKTQYEQIYQLLKVHDKACGSFQSTLESQKATQRKVISEEYAGYRDETNDKFKTECQEEVAQPPNEGMPAADEINSIKSTANAKKRLKESQSVRLKGIMDTLRDEETQALKALEKEYEAAKETEKQQKTDFQTYFDTKLKNIVAPVEVVQG